MTQFDDLAVPMTYDEAVASLYARIPGVMKPGLERIHALLGVMGNPETNAPIVRVVGTNGKTSTTLMTAAVLQAFNLTVGSFTSPHLQVVNERIRLNGEPIDDDAFLRMAQLLSPFLAMVDAQETGSVSYFETLTALAYSYFADVPVNVAVMEAGMGGKWDATNVGVSDVIIITPIAMDHPELGDTLAQKAEEKAGIINPESVVICATQPPEVMAVIEARCAQVNATLKIYGKDFELSGRERAVGGQLIDITGVASEINEVFLPLLGHHQAMNATLAFVAAEALFDFEAKLDVDAVRDAFANVKSPGRLERIYRDGEPLVLLDGAHNPAGMASLATSLKEDFSFERTILIMGMLNDKDIEASAEIIRDLADEFIVIAPPSSRAGDPKRLVEALGKNQGLVTVVQDLDEAFSLATNATRKDRRDAIVVTGSLYLVGAARDYLNQPIR